MKTVQVTWWMTALVAVLGGCGGCGEDEPCLIPESGAGSGDVDAAGSVELAGGERGSFDSALRVAACDEPDVALVECVDDAVEIKANLGNVGDAGPVKVFLRVHMDGSAAARDAWGDDSGVSVTIGDLARGPAEDTVTENVVEIAPNAARTGVVGTYSATWDSNAEDATGTGPVVVSGSFDLSCP
jgi:hypothetical protein